MSWIFTSYKTVFTTWYLLPNQTQRVCNFVYSSGAYQLFCSNYFISWAIQIPCPNWTVFCNPMCFRLDKVRAFVMGKKTNRDWILIKIFLPLRHFFRLVIIRHYINFAINEWGLMLDKNSSDNLKNPISNLAREGAYQMMNYRLLSKPIQTQETHI